MINELKRAIAQKLKSVFEGFKVYTVNPVSEYTEPCFIVDCLGFDNSDLLTLTEEQELIFVNYLFSITLLLPRDHDLLESVSSRVLLCLKWLFLEDGTPVLTTNRQANKIDDTSFNFTFSILREVKVNKDQDYMEYLFEDIKTHE